LFASLGLAIAAVALARYSLERDRASLISAPTPGAPVPAATQPVLIMNLKSGGGKAEKFKLADECRARDIEPVVLQRGDDLLQLAEAAIERGADVIGMAGGDGSQALVASVAARRGVAHVVIPAGTRNHFALDLGLDRDDVVGALDAFGPAVERRIDLAEVNGRVFVNNVSLGVYGQITQSEEYRDAKVATTLDQLPTLLGPGGKPMDLGWTGPDGVHHDSAHLIQVSNNRYSLRVGGGAGTRDCLDDGKLGILAVEVPGTTSAVQLAALVALRRPDGARALEDWTSPTFEVTSGAPVAAGVDGEALELESPLRFRILPCALRVRLPEKALGYAPAAIAGQSAAQTLGNVWRVARGQVPHPPLA
jgi:diacylglycerol kinase family enzyme